MIENCNQALGTANVGRDVEYLQYQFPRFDAGGVGRAQAEIAVPLAGQWRDGGRQPIEIADNPLAFCDAKGWRRGPQS